MEKLLIEWSWQDVQALDESLTEAQCKEFLAIYSKRISDRSTEEGWHIIQDLLSMHIF